MNLLNIIKNFINKIFNKNHVKKLESPKEDNNMIHSNSNFKDTIKVNLNTKESKKEQKKNIETLQCENDGLGFQKIKKY